MTKKNKLLIDAFEAREAMDLAQKDCDIILKFALFLENIGIAKDKELFYSRNLWTFNFLRELHHLQRIRPDLYKLIQKTIDSVKTKGAPY